jgi:hypothetical protein
MSERGDPREPEERRAAELVRALSAPRPDPVYRARLKREFVAGSLTSPSIAGTISGEESPRRGVWDTLLVPAAAAVLVVAGLVLNRGPGWQVLEVRGTGSAQVNGHTIALSERARLARAIREGARIRLPAGVSMTLAAPGRLAVEITPETEAALSASVARSARTRYLTAP